MGSNDEMKLEFPETKSCRSTWSFRNGIYLAETNQFFPHESPEIPQDKVPIMSFDHSFNVAAWKKYSEELENIRPVTGMSDLHNMPIPELMPLALIDRITDNQLDKATLFFRLCYLSVLLRWCFCCELAIAADSVCGKYGALSGQEPGLVVSK